MGAEGAIVRVDDGISRGSRHYRPPIMPAFRAFFLLRCALAFLASSGVLSAAEPLTTVAAVRALSYAEAAAGSPVRLSGVVSYLRLTERDFNFNLHDASGGIMVYAVERAAVQPGQFVTITGVTAMSVHGARIASARVEPGELRGLPAARPVTLGEVLEGRHEGEFAELEGIVRVARLEAPEIFPRRLALDFGSRDRRLTAWITHYEGLAQTGLVAGASVRVRGVVLTWTNPRGQPQSRSLLANSLGDVTLLSAAGEPPRLPIRELLFWDGARSPARPVQASGIVTFYQPGEFAVVQEDGLAIRARPEEGTPLGEMDAMDRAEARSNPGRDGSPGNPAFGELRPGDRVNVLGFPALGDYTVELEDARLTRAGSGELPQPEQFPDAAAVLAGRGLVDRDARLVSLPATLRHIREREGRRALEMESGKLGFTAWLPADAVLPDLVRPGARLQLTGICTLQLGETERRLGRAPNQFSLLLYDSDGIRTLVGAPWWNARRLLQALSVAGGVALVLGAWAWMLQRKNRLLREEIRARERAERELSGERRRVAGELHDTLEQTLVAASLQLNAASRTLALEPDAAGGQVLLARQLVDRSRQEVRDAVWDLRVGEARGEPLSALLRRICEESSAAGVDVAFSLEGSEPDIPPHISAQAIRLVREALANGLKHARARRVSVRMRATGGTALHLDVTDDGQGFERATAAGPDTGHFGLAGMEERVQRLGGSLRIESEPGKGAALHFEIPLTA